MDILLKFKYSPTDDSKVKHKCGGLKFIPLFKRNQYLYKDLYPVNLITSCTNLKE